MEIERNMKINAEDDDQNMCPLDFRCPISMELMKDPVTICTGVSYDRKNIEKWFVLYKKKTCPATMQSIPNFDVTPNHTLKRLILDWLDKDKHHNKQESTSSCSCSSSSIKSKHDEMVSLLHTVGASPFKVTPLKKLRSIIEMGDRNIRSDFIRSGGVEALVQILVQILLVDQSSDFVAFRACEESLGVLHLILPEDDSDDEEEIRSAIFQFLSKPESMKSMAIVLQRGSAEARLYIISIFRKIMTQKNYDWSHLIKDQGVDLLKSLLELLSDDQVCHKATTCALEVLIEILGSSKKSRLRAVEAGAVCVLIDLLPDCNGGSKCEKMLLLIKLLCECADGRLALVEHAMGIAAVSKMLLHVSNTATKLGVKIMWLICSSHPTERVLEELLICGSVKKLVALLHMDGRSSTKDKVIKMFKMHGNSWRRYPCFPCEIKDYLGLGN